MKSKKVDSKNDADKVNEYMNKLEHPLKPEIEALRIIIRNASPKISERIKWNAPSYYYKEDLATFNPRATNHVHIVFHHAEIVNIHSMLLEGDYKDRRMIYLRTMEEVKANKKELEKIMNELVERMEK